MELVRHERILCWNSAYKQDRSANNANCTVHYSTHGSLDNTHGVRCKSVTLTNLFPNVYGMHASLWIDNGGLTEISFEEQDVQSTAALDALLQAAIQAVVGGTVTVTTTANIMTITSTNPFTILKPNEVYEQTGNVVSMNELIGHDPNHTSTTTPYTFNYKVNLIGPRICRVYSTNICSSNSIHPNVDIGDAIATLSLHDVAHGACKTHHVSEAENNKHLFPDYRNINSIQVRLKDEFEQQLSLPPNAHLELEFIVNSYS